MDLIEAQIAEIKNLNLIYIFSTDNILRNNSNKYIGAKVLYNKNKTLSLDYNSKYFEEFLKKILTRYNKEKDKRDIILLGDLTKQLVKDSFFTITEEKKDINQPAGILVNPKKNDIMRYNKYLSKLIKVILKTIKNYDYVNIDSIDGFNNKYVVNYSIGNIKKQIYMLIFVKDDESIDFRITNIDGQNVNINGNITDEIEIVKINWNEEIQKYNGEITYNSKENIIQEKLYKESQLIIYNEDFDTLLDEDELIISFYMNLCNLKVPKKVMKVDDNCYLLSDINNIVEQSDEIFYKNSGCQISVFDDQVIIKQREKHGLSKYDDQIKVVLEESIQEFILKKINIDNEYYILIEKRTKNNNGTQYSYSFIKLKDNQSLFIPFNIENQEVINETMKTFDKAKQYIKKNKGRNTK